MYKTRHFETRCRQRRIAGFEIDLAILFGAPRGERTVSENEAAETLLRLPKRGKSVWKMALAGTDWT